MKTQWVISIVIILIILFGAAYFSIPKKETIECPEPSELQCELGVSIIKDSNGCKISICLEDQISSCNSTGGTWKTFGDGCADKCYSGGGHRICTLALENSCDCGPDKCWNGISCEPD